MRINRRARTGGLRWFQTSGLDIHYGFITIHENGYPVYGCMTYELNYKWKVEN